MADYLGQHQEIGMAKIKETHYLVGGLAPRLQWRAGRQRSREEYLALFAGVQDKRRLGEASVWYLYSRTAPQTIDVFSPGGQIIVMLRNPIEMLASLHSEFVQQEIEPVGDLETALSLDDERIAQGTPRGFPPHSYRDAVRYAEQIERYLQVVGRERLHVIIYEDLRDDTEATFRATCRFLGVDEQLIPEMKVVNANRRTRSRRLQRLIRRPPQPLRAFLHSFTSQELRSRGSLLLKRLNRKVIARDPIPASVAHSLRPDVEREVQSLQSLLGLDVSRWLADCTPEPRNNLHDPPPIAVDRDVSS